MKVIDLNSTKTMERNIAWSGWPAKTIRWGSSCALVCATSVACLLVVDLTDHTALRSKSQNASHALQNAVSECRQIIQSVRDENRPDPQHSEQPDERSSALDSGNWRIDSAGRRWVYDAALTRWVRTP